MSLFCLVFHSACAQIFRCPATALLLSAGVSQAQTNYSGDFKVVGTAQTQAYPLKFSANQAAADAGTSDDLQIISCTVPAGGLRKRGVLRRGPRAVGGTDSPHHGGRRRRHYEPHVVFSSPPYRAFISVRPAQAWSPGLRSGSSAANHRATPLIPHSNFPSRTRQ